LEIGMDIKEDDHEDDVECCEFEKGQKEIEIDSESEVEEGRGVFE
jgi:hypothetical protein